MARFAILILALCLYAGVEALFSTVVTGTTGGEVVVNTVFPLVIAVVAIAGLWRIFK